MKHVVVGDCNSIFVKQYIESVYENKDNVILIVENPLTQSYGDYYRSNGVHLEPFFSENSLLKRIPVLRSILGSRLWVRRIIKKYGSIDTVHIHSLNYSHSAIAKAFKAKTNRLVITIWGDELLRWSKKKSIHLKPFYALADIITLSTPIMNTRFKELYGEILANKVSMCGFGLGILDEIIDVSSKYNRAEICKHLGFLCANKINVYIGHNGREAQRHEELTKLMIQLPQEVKERINLVYTMTYGVPSTQYLTNLKEMAYQTGCTISFIEGYKTEEEVAMIRLACDIMVHAQLTDAASASIRECMFAGAIVLNGAWLPYNDIPNYKERIFEYEKVEDLPKILSNIVCNYDEYKLKYESNRYNWSGLWSLKTAAIEWRKALGIAE